MSYTQPPQWQSNPLDQPLSKLELSLSCKNLKNMDWLSKSDPIVVVYQKNNVTNRFQELGRTEMILDNLNPEFVKKFIIDFLFEEVQQMKFEVYDIGFFWG